MLKFCHVHVFWRTITTVSKLLQSGPGRDGALETRRCTVRGPVDPEPSSSASVMVRFRSAISAQPPTDRIFDKGQVNFIHWRILVIVRLTLVL